VTTTAAATDLDNAVATARHRYVDDHPVSAEWAQRAAEVLPGGNTRSVLHVDPFPFRVATAQRQYLLDVDGHRYVDLLGNYTAGLLGHSPEPVRRAVHDAIDRGWAFGAVHADEVRLAEALVERFDSIEQVRFTNSGTEANLMALALATAHTGRRSVLVFAGGYHGSVVTFAGHREVDVDVNVPHDWVVSTYNDLDAVAAVFDERGDELAAVLVEPLQGSSGCIPATREFLQLLRDRASRHGAVLVFDEVMTSRLAPGGAQQLHGVVPDVTTLGKYLAGGFSFGAFGGSRSLMAEFDPARGGRLGHAGTFNNNVVSMAAGVAALTEVLTDDALGSVNRRGERLRAALNDTFRRHELPMCATGAGSLMNVHGVTGPVSSVDDLRDNDDRWKELLWFDALDAGFHLARRGFVALSLEVTDDDVDRFVSFVDRWAERVRALRGSSPASRRTPRR
jgi:glutamate-1-semialdehyde 2,1-aminomutase